MSDTTFEFISTFEALKAEINKRAGDPNAFEFKLDRAATNDRFVSNNRKKLQYIREVRDLLQHPQTNTPVRPFSISEGFLADTRDLLKRLANPPVAKDFWVPRASLTLARAGDRIGDLADTMRQRGFSHLPILDPSGAVVGVFNEAAVFAHLWKEEVTLIERGNTVADIMDSCSLGVVHTETFEFVRPVTPQDKLVDLFTKIPSPSTRVGAVFVTASGSPKDQLQGLITPWDVLARMAD
jgi:predicted transcriptional regulator